MKGDTSSKPSSNDEPLDVKPLRCLAPMFPAPYGYTTFTPPNAPPSFVCVTPFGPFPPGFVPFVPPGSSSEAQRPADQTPNSEHRTAPSGEDSFFKSPVSSPPHAFQTPPPFSAAANGRAEQSRKMETPEAEGSLRTRRGSAQSSSKRQAVHVSSSTMDSSETEESTGGKVEKRRGRKKTKTSVDTAVSSPADGDRESVNRVLMTFDALRRRLLQLEDVREPVAGASKRPDLKAGATMMNRGIRVNMRRRVGAVPGVEVGDLFFFRFELCLVGLHAPSMGGIDYMNVKFGHEEEPVALSIVSSGMYEDDDNDVDVLVYSGQGGSKVGKQVNDQKLERGNRALERSSCRKNEIRVIRGMKDVMNPPNKIYVYDGLYKIQQSWIEKAKSGFSVFKYKLLRVPGQSNGIVIWKLTQRWKENPTSRSHLILQDISSGIENLPVCLVNDVDKEKGPPHFSYVSKVKYLKPMGFMRPSVGCACHSVCMPGDSHCSCGKRNSGYLPYSSNGLLVRHREMVYECGAYCACSPNCRNRVSQKGIRFRFEVFKTKDRGWGLRSWDPIRAGSFVCEYTGDVIDEIKNDEEDEEDEYLFEAAYPSETPYVPNNIYDMAGEERPVDLNTSSKPLPIIITAENSGNMSRFMNHCCSPNVFWQPVLYDHDDECYPHIMFYAMKHIPPMTELTYDYGLRGNESPRRQRKKCLCGSEKCRGFFV